MKKSERIIKDKHSRQPEKYKKVDTTVNGDAELLVEKHKEVEKDLYPLKIDCRTVIYVTKDKLTQEYAEKKRKSMKLDNAPKKKGGRRKIHIN